MSKSDRLAKKCGGGGEGQEIKKMHRVFTNNNLSQLSQTSFISIHASLLVKQTFLGNRAMLNYLIFIFPLIFP